MFTPLEEKPKEGGGQGFTPLAEAPPPSEGVWDKARRFISGIAPVQSVGDERMARLDTPAELPRPPGAGIMFDAASPLEQSRARLAPIAPTIGPIPGREATAGNIVSDLAGTLPQSGKATREGIRSIFADVIGADSMAADARRKGGQVVLEDAVSAPQFESDTAGAIYGGVKSAVQTAPGIAASFVNPALGLGILGAQTGAPDYNKFRDRGASPGMAGLGAAGTAGTEIATELMPMGFLVSKFGKVGAGQFLSGLLAREVPGEQVATLVQDAIDTAVANPEKTWGDYARERPGAAYQTLISTITQGGLMAGANKAAQFIAKPGEAAPIGRPVQPAAVAPAQTAPEAPSAPAQGFTPLTDAIKTAFPGMTVPKSGSIVPSLGTEQSAKNAQTAPVLDSATNEAEKATPVQNSALSTQREQAPKVDTPTLQNRDRSSAASIAQMNSIAADPDAARLSFSREFASGAPVVFSNQDAATPQAIGRTDQITDANGKKYEITYAVVDARTITPSNRVDGSSVPEYLDNDTPGRIRAVAGNGRLAGLQAAFDRGTAAKYVEGIGADAALHGIAPEALAGIERPTLVRMMKSADVNGQIGDLSNQSGVSALNASEQARTDSERVDFDALEFDDAGNPTLNAVTRFVQNMPAAEQGGLMVNQGAPSKQASERLMAATFNRAYGDPALVELHAQATDPEARIVLSGLAQAASSMAKLEGAGALDIRPLVVEAAQAAVNAARRGISLSKLAQQQDMQIAPDSFEFIRYFAANYRSAKRIGEKLREMADFAYTEANKSDTDMFGAVARATPADVIGKLKDETSSAAVMEKRGGYETAPNAAARAAAGSGQGVRAVSEKAQGNRAAEEGELTLAEVEAIQDIPTVEKMREAVATVGEEEFRRRVNATMRARHYKRDGTPWPTANDPHHRAAAVEGEAIKIVAFNRRNKVAESDDLLTTYTPADIAKREQAQKDAARRENAPPPETFELESEDERTESKQAEDAGQARLFQRDLFGANVPESGRLDYAGADTAGRVDQPREDRGAAGQRDADLPGSGLLRSGKTHSTVVAKEIPGAKKPRPRILHKQVADSFEKGDAAALIGATVNSMDELASLAQIYRDPRYETFRVFFTDKAGKVIDASAVSSRLPGETATFTTAEGGPAEFVRERMKLNGATAYYLLHNHPSGNPEASGGDLSVTANIANYVPGFKGHVIVNSNAYGVVEMKPEPFTSGERPEARAVYREQKDDRLLNPRPPFQWQGEQITDPADIAKIGKSLQRDGWLGVIASSGVKGVRTLAEVPESLLQQPVRLAAWLRRIAVHSGGGSRVFLYMDKAPKLAVHETLDQLMEKGIIVDAVSGDGFSARDRNFKTLPIGKMARTKESDRRLLEDQSGYRTDRQRARWRDVKYNDVGPVYLGDGFVLDAQREIEITGDDLTHGLPMGHATSVDKGNQVIAFTIRGYRGEEMGYTALQITPDGDVAALHDIEVKGKQKGLGRRVVGGIVASQNKPVKIVQIVPASEPFWDKVGTGSIDPYGNSEISWPTFAQSARRSAGRVAPQDVSVEAAKQGSARTDRDAGTAREEVTPYGRAPAVETPAFKNWFGASKVVDSDGKPLVVYHARRAGNDFTSFRDDRPIFFAKTKSEASRAASPSTPHDHVAAYLSAQNPANTPSTPVHFLDVIKAFAAKPNADLVYVDDEAGVSFAVRRSSQVKSVDNRGTFDAEDSSIVREEATPYPARTADTMSDAIAIDSPNGRMSKRAHDAATKRLGEKLFGPGGGTRAQIMGEQTQPSEQQRLLEQAARLRDLAARGMSTKKFTKAADQLEAAAKLLDEPSAVREDMGEYGKPTGLARIIDPVTHRLKVGEKAYAALDKYVGQLMLAKIGLASNTPPSFKRLMQQFRADKGKAAESARTVAEAGESLPAPERTLISDYIEGELKAGIVPPAHILDVAKTMDAALAEQTKTLVELGMLSKETAERWQGRYLPRYYSKDMSNTLMGRLFRIGIRGNHMKARGTFDTVPVDQLAHWQAMGFEVREFYENENPEFVTVWRDWTKQERESMGEMRDGVYRFARGMMETGSDIASAKLFSAIAKSEHATRNRAMALQKGWKKVPSDEIEGTALKKYGALSAMYIDPAIWKELAFEFRDKGAFERSLAQLTALWKEGKTAMNPSTHAANVASSIMMADFAGISPLNVKAYVAALRDFLGDGPATKAAIDIGLLGGEAIHEIRQWLPEPGTLLAANTPGAIAAAFNSKAALMLGKYSGASFYRSNMRKLYGAEDAFFKILIFKHYTGRGMAPAQAADEANRYIFDYRDLPPLVQRIRDSAIGIPFISYTYKAIPAVAHSILTRPWIVAKYAAIFNGINALAFAIGGDDDEEKERKNMPQYMKGWTPLFYPTHIRMMNDSADNPQYLNIARLTPLGTVMQPMHGEGVPMLQSFAPNHPVYQMILTLGFNRDALTGRDFFKPSDDLEDRIKKGSKYVYQQLAPATPVMPGSAAWDKVMNGVSEAMDRPIDTLTGSYTGKVQGRSGREETLPKAVANTVLGVNLRGFDPDEQAGFKRRDVTREMGEIRANIRRHSTNQGIGDETRQARIAGERAKLDKIRDRLQDSR